MLEVELKSVVDDVRSPARVVERAGGTLALAGRLEDRRYDTSAHALARAITCCGCGYTASERALARGARLEGTHAVARTATRCARSSAYTSPTPTCSRTMLRDWLRGDAGDRPRDRAIRARAAPRCASSAIRASTTSWRWKARPSRSSAPSPRSACRAMGSPPSACRTSCAGSRRVPESALRSASQSSR